MEIRDNIIKKWYNINKILIRIFIVWILIIPLGHIIVPYNYYYYYSTGVHKYYEDLEIIKDKFSINLSDDSLSFFPFRNRQKMSLIFEKLGIKNIDIYTVVCHNKNMYFEKM